MECIDIIALFVGGVMVGSVVGSYRITRQIGEGGMGRVYLAEHQLIGKSAAVKVLLPQYSANTDVVTRFFNEARASSMLKHPGVIDIYDFGKTSDGAAFIVMEFLEGESLYTRLQRDQRLQTDFLVDVARQVASALAAAHARGIVHRDLKPDNIFLLADAELRSGVRVKILDFGIAKLTDDARTTKSGSTRTGAIIGTPTYMSPEQCRGAGKVDHRTDIYALGCVMVEMASGRPPFVGEGPGDVIAAHMFADPPALNGFLPDALAESIARMLVKLPQDRFQSMNDVIAALTKPSEAARPTSAARASGEALPTVRMATPTPSELHPNATRFISTTLGGASGEVSSGHRTFPARTARWIAAGTAAAAVLAVAAIVVLKKTGPAASPVADPPRTQVTAPTATPTPTQPAIEAKPSQPPPAVAAARRVNVHLESRPLGADVFRASDGVRVGRTPLDREFDKSSSDAVFLLKMHGYQDTSTSVMLDRDVTKTIVLERVAAHRPRPAAPPSGPVEKKPSKNGIVDPFDN